MSKVKFGIWGQSRIPSLDMPRNQKLHAVSPPMAKEIAEKLGWGDGGVLASEIAKLYQEALTSTQQGKVFSYQ